MRIFQKIKTLTGSKIIHILNGDISFYNKSKFTIILLTVQILLIVNTTNLQKSFFLLIFHNLSSWFMNQIYQQIHLLPLLEL